MENMPYQIINHRLIRGPKVDVLDLPMCVTREESKVHKETYVKYIVFKLGME